MKKTYPLIILSAIIASAASGLESAVPSEATLVRDGREAVVIVLSGDAHITSRAAAGELVKHVELMTGIELPVVIRCEETHTIRSVRIHRARPEDLTYVIARDEGRSFQAVPLSPKPLNADDAGDMENVLDLIPIRIGETADAALDGLIKERSGMSNAFALIVDADGIQIRALQPAGAQHAVYELLEQLGVRWCDPLWDGRVVPILPNRDNTLTIAYQETVKTPSHEMRWMPPVTPRSTVYTARMKAEHIERVRQSRYTFPTASSDENFVVGRSRGSDDQGLIYEAGHIPPITDRDGNPVDVGIAPQPLYGYRITDPEADGVKKTIVLTAGNHNEPTGCWSLHAVIEFLLGDDPRAAAMRRKAEFYVYPLVNPEGRYILSRVRSPEVVGAGWHNHNRVWTTAGIISTIDTMSAAMRYDTRCDVDYLLDFHSGAAHSIYVPHGLMESAFIRAMIAREGKKPAGSSGTGTTPNFALHADGLRSPRAYTPENDDWKPLAHCLQVGLNYALSLYDVLTGKYDDAGEGVNSDYGAPLEAGAPPPVRQRDASELLQAVARGNLEAAKKRVEAGDDINGTNSVGNTALHLAAEQGHDEIVTWLIANGADLTSANHRGWTPLHYAVRYDNQRIAALLIEQGADVNARHIDGDTPLHLAAAYNRGDIARLLLDAGSDPAARGAWDRTPLDWARRLGHLDTIELMK